MTERVLRAGLAGVAAFAAGYLLPGTLRLPVLIYDPVARVAFFGSAPSGAQMRYYGDLLCACACGLSAAGIAFAVRRRRGSLAVACATAMSLVALDVLFYLSRLLAAR